MKIEKCPECKKYHDISPFEIKRLCRSEKELEQLLIEAKVFVPVNSCLYRRIQVRLSK